MSTSAASGRIQAMVKQKRKGDALPKVILAALFALIVASAAAIVAVRLPYVRSYLNLDEHIALWKEGPDQGAMIRVPRVVYKADGEEAVEDVTLPSFGRDILHLSAEAALIPAGEGFVSYIPEGTELIGISERDGYIYIDLTDEIRDADRMAFKEIERTLALSVDFIEIRFMINGKLIG